MGKSDAALLMRGGYDENNENNKEKKAGIHQEEAGLKGLHGSKGSFDAL